MTSKGALRSCWYPCKVSDRCKVSAGSVDVFSEREDDLAHPRRRRDRVNGRGLAWPASVPLVFWVLRSEFRLSLRRTHVISDGGLASHVNGNSELGQAHAVWL